MGITLIRQKGFIMKKTKIVIFSIVIVGMIALAVSCINTYREKEFLQRNIDQIFTYHFSLLNSNQMMIALNPDFTEQEFTYYNDEVTKSGHIISTLFASTSYRESVELNSIVGLLDQATGSDAFNQLNMTEELNQKLSEIQVGNFSNETQITETLAVLKSCISQK